MTAEAWRRVGDLFHQAVEIAPENRAAWARGVCGEDSGLLRELSSLLESDQKAREGFVQNRVKGGVVDFYEHDARARMPKRAGPYRLMREIGRGGMGTVYLGQRDDEHYSIDVAVKVVTPGMDTAFVLRRFRRERQILAGFDHPNIARLLDGGTTEEGLPYIVMEYVDGLRITDYCREQALGLEQRLRLFLDVCAAVEYAHRQFVVHRDIKPGNILVNRSGVPKLLDFGICKLLLPESIPSAGEDTYSEGRMMTPDYASPEQVRGEAATAASDIYSLSAVLFELLTEAKPHRFANSTLREIERAICEDEVTRPSLTVTDRGRMRQLKGDLDLILLTALGKDPRRRYAAVAEFAADLQRHLERLPVKAVPSTMAYRTGKFVRRHSKTLGAASAAGTLVLGAALLAEHHDRVANQRLRRDLAAAEIRLGLLYFAQHERANAAAAYAEAVRLVGLEPAPAAFQSDPATQALERELRQLEADLASGHER